MARRRSRSSEELSPAEAFAEFLLIAPWYFGPIIAAAVFVFMRWIIPFCFPVPADPTKPENVMANLIASFAQGFAPAAPFFSAIVLFLWILAEVVKFAKRMTQPASNSVVPLPAVDSGERPSYPISTSAPPQRVNSRPFNVVSSDAGDMIDISQMDWAEFERLLVVVLRRFGFEAKRTGRSGPDGGIDIECTNSQGELIIVQCKHWRQREVGVKVVREFFGILVHEEAGRGLIITSGLFTGEAKSFAEGKPLTLIDGTKLLELLSGMPTTEGEPKPRYRISHLEEKIAEHACPKCGSRLILKHGRHGDFLGCEQYPSCKFTQNL